VAFREEYTKGSETAKFGTDEQKQYMRLFEMGKQAHLCNAPDQQISNSRYCRNRKKENAFTWGGLGIDLVSMSREVSRSHSSCRKRAANRDCGWSHKVAKD